MRTTRQQIIALLQNKHHLSAPELSRALHLTPANIRHHLSILEKEGVLEVTGARKTFGRGRPIRIFTLTQQVSAHNLDILAVALLEELQLAASNDRRQDIYCHIAARLVGSEIIPEPSLTKRLYLTVQRLNEMHYQARWEAHADAPRIFLEHCPYAAILPDHPELCQIDALLLGKLINHPVVQMAKLEKDSHGARYCLFTTLK